jgi:putative redox protein
LRFVARSNGARLLLDGTGERGPSPMQSLAFALAGCMAIDVVHFLDRSRARPIAVRLWLEGRRASGDPGRFVAVALHFTIDGAASDAQVARALALSRAKYCSVWHSMRQDLALDVSFTVNRPQKTAR